MTPVIKSTTTAILLPQVYPITHPEHYKLHLACGYSDAKRPGGFVHPLDDFVADREEWDSWNYSPRTLNDFSRDFIFALMEFYPEKDRWLLGGAYRVLDHTWKAKKWHYEIEVVKESEPFIGRLRVQLRREGRAKAVYFEKYYAKLVVADILSEPYSGEQFCGYDWIDLGFATLEHIVHQQRSDWRAALQHAKGVYLITDTGNGKRYVGSAYGVTGLWLRWECYVDSGHGYSDEITRLISKHGLDYARTFFRFSLLEDFPMKTDEEVIIGREAYWKRILLSRGKYGFNRN